MVTKLINACQSIRKWTNMNFLSCNLVNEIKKSQFRGKNFRNWISDVTPWGIWDASIIFHSVYIENSVFEMCSASLKRDEV